MGIVRDLYYARKMSAGLKLPAPTVALLIKRLRLAAAMGGDITKTVSGTMVHITDALAKAALSVLVSIEPIQSGSGDPAPDNVRPISGLTGLSVYRRGKNLLNAATNITGKYISSSGSISNGDDAQYTDLIPVNEGETYVCSLVSGRNSGTNRWHGYDANGTWVKQLAYLSVAGQQGNKLVMVAAIDPGISYVRLSYGIADTEAMIEEIAYTHSIADKFYEGFEYYLVGCLKNLIEIQSPFTSGGTSLCPATLYSVEPGKMYAVENNVPPAAGLFTGFYASIDDVTDATKAVGNTWQQLFTVPDGANYAVTAYLKSGTGTTYTFDKPMVSEVSTDYQPYGYDEYHCDWLAQAGTVYGGTVDVVTGVLTVDRAYADLGTASWTKRNTSTGHWRFTTQDFPCVIADSTSTVFDCVCSQYEKLSPSDTYAGNTGVSNNTSISQVCVCDERYSDKDTFTTAMSGVQLVYELAAPLTYQLTAQEVQMLLDENYVWASSGDTVSVTYYAEGNANPLQSLNILLGGNYSNPKTADDVSDREALEIILGGNK